MKALRDRTGLPENKVFEPAEISDMNEEERQAGRVICAGGMRNIKILQCSI